MISFDLKCIHGHVFEAWFRSSSDYESQRGSRMIACPTCGNADIAKAAMAPAVAAKSNRRADGNAAMQSVAMAGNSPDATQLRAALEALAEVQARMLEQSEWVGDKFVEQARAMHYGEAEFAAIHGTARPDEARAMMEEGLPVSPLIIPVAPPDQTH
jgi:hypothetical protein